MVERANKLQLAQRALGQTAVLKDVLNLLDRHELTGLQVARRAAGKRTQSEDSVK
jgi:hypothetical protein